VRLMPASSFRRERRREVVLRLPLSRENRAEILYMQQENRLLCNFGTTIAMERFN
jgi:hypothetical protein